jgi:hypothetical protein
MGNSLSPSYRASPTRPSHDPPPTYSEPQNVLTFEQIAHDALLVICRAYVSDNTLHDPADITAAFEVAYGKSTGVNQAPGIAYTLVRCHDAGIDFPHDRYS